MQIILLKDLDKVGDKHDVVSVKDGYGRNFLIPQGLALVANATNMGKLNEMKKADDIRESRKLSDYQAIADKLKGVTLRIGAKAGTSGKIFGSVTNLQLANALKEQVGIEIERKKIHLGEEIKNVGSYTAELHLHKQVISTVDFEVVEE
ncbi:MAG: 50S ribosomal protein L9 [Saprospiraceae bacterium]